MAAGRGTRTSRAVCPSLERLERMIAAGNHLQSLHRAPLYREPSEHLCTPSSLLDDPADEMIAHGGGGGGRERRGGAEILQADLRSGALV